MVEPWRLLSFSPAFPTLFVAFVIGLVSLLGAADGDAVRTRPLDLPSGGVGAEDSEEDVPEIITFYGGIYESDAFFWCLDRSGSMSGNQIETLKNEVTQAILSLSDAADFGLASFSNNYTVWSMTVRRANTTNKAAAIGWVTALQTGSGTNFGPAGVATVALANQSTKRNRNIIVVGDGAIDTGEINNVTSANYQAIPIHTILIGNRNVQSMQTLAALNNGTFRNIQ